MCGGKEGAKGGACQPSQVFSHPLPRPIPAQVPKQHPGAMGSKMSAAASPQPAQLTSCGTLEPSLAMTMLPRPAVLPG